MIKTETISIRVNSMNYRYYQEFGYSVLTESGAMARDKIIDVDIKHAKYSYGCGPAVEVECDRCERLFSIKIGSIYKQIKSKNTCYCSNCNNSISTKEIMKTRAYISKKDLKKVDTVNLCSGGCGKKATHQSKVGRFWCNRLGGMLCEASQLKAVETFNRRCHNIGNKNGMFGKVNSSEMKKYKSDIMKEKIRNGEFTPNITNSWANSKTFLQIDDCNYYFRSSWEAIFWLKNRSLEYEKIRIPYEDEDGRTRNYLVDFIDCQNKKLYEVKPTSEKSKTQNILKTCVAEKWSTDNGYEYQLITEEWFKKYLTEDDVTEFSKFGEKIINGLKGLLK